MGKLNPIIRGWANYHRHVCSAKAFWNADRAIHYQLLRWAKRTHPNKPYRWLKHKYSDGQINALTPGAKAACFNFTLSPLTPARQLHAHGLPLHHQKNNQPLRRHNDYVLSNRPALTVQDVLDVLEILVVWFDVTQSRPGHQNLAEMLHAIAENQEQRQQR